MARKPADLHFLARILVGTRAADETRRIGGMHYDNLIQRVKDALQQGHQHLWRPSDTTQEGNTDDAPQAPHPVPLHPRRDRTA